MQVSKTLVFSRKCNFLYDGRGKVLKICNGNTQEHDRQYEFKNTECFREISISGHK